MMHKKLLSLLLTIAMALSLGVSAFAASNSMNNFAKAGTYTNNFSDVSATAWYTPSVKVCYEYGLMQGPSATRFNPTGSLTVAEALVMADRVHILYATGKNTLENGTPWYQPYVDYALKSGIIQANDFSDYTAKISRADMAYLFSNALPAAQLSAVNSVSALPDVTASTARSTQIFRLYNAGVLTGADAFGTFHPTATITRAEAAAIIARVAIPANRKTFTLFERYTVGATTFGMPAGSTKTTDDNSTTVATKNNTLIAAVYTDTNSEYSGYSITVLTKEYLMSLVTDAMPADVIASGSEITAVKFGSTEAYRLSFTAASNGVQAPCYGYFYISGDTMYCILFLSFSGSDQLATAVNSVTVNGNAVSAKI